MKLSLFTSRVAKVFIRRKTWFICLLIFFQLFQILYFEKSFFLEPYDYPYWKDRFEHSQWQLPLSKRIVGDDGLYGYVGYQLIQGASPDFVNAETPPLGKYLIGLSIKIFGSPAYYALFFGLGSLLLFYLLVRRLINSLTALFLTAVLFLEPLFFSQLWHAWLDIGQLFFLLANLFFLWSSPVLAGIALGFFSVSKTPLLLPVIFGLETIYFLLRRRWRQYLIFVAGAIIAVLLVYSRYFALGHSLVDFLKLQKYMIGFYQQSQLKTHLGAVWQTLFFGRFPDVSSGTLGSVAEWWIFWPILTILGIGTVLKVLRAKNKSWFWKGLAVFIFSSLLIYSFVPIYPRYLLIIWPFLLLFSAKAIKKFAGIIILASFIRAFLFLWPTPDLTLNNFYYNLAHQYFQDIYQENLAQESRPVGSREEFRRISQGTLGQATVRAIKVEEKERKIPRFGNEGEIKLVLTYKTLDLGPFSEEKTIKLAKEANQWKIIWDWEILLNDFRPGYQIETKTILGKRGTIFGAKGKVLVQDGLGYLLSVEPSKIDPQKEEALLELISELSGLGGVHLYNAYQENILPEATVPLVSLSVIPDEQTLKDLLSYQGLTLTKYPVRVYNNFSPTDIQNLFYHECCTRIYSRYSYRGAAGPEKQFDDLLYGYDGGRILMKNEKGESIRIILEKEAKNGQDVVLKK